MTPISIARLGSIKSAEHFQEHLRCLGIRIPCDKELQNGHESSLRQPLIRRGIRIDNRIAVQPMEGWDCALDGNPTENTIRRWQRFGRSGAKLIWGGEAAAVSQDGRANPNQLLVAPHTEKGLDQLRRILIEEHRRTTGSGDGLLIGLQLTHSGRYSRPNAGNRGEPRILYRHPILDGRLKLASDYPVLTDGEVQTIIGNFHRAAAIAQKLGFDFVDIKHCHGYLGHEFLSARTREGAYGGSFDGRSRFLREVVQGINSGAPKLHVAVRLSAFDTIPFRPDVTQSSNGKLGSGIPESHEAMIPYRWGFGVDALHPTETDLTETIQFLALLEELGIRMVNITGGSPYYNPHIQRPALYPPSDGYQPPEDPLLGVARQMDITQRLKEQFPNLIFVGSAYSYLQDFLPYVAQAAVRDRWTDFVGLGRMVLSYPEILWDASEGKPLQRKLVCRTFSDCTTAPRNGLVSGCYPLDKHYKDSQAAVRLKAVKQGHVNPRTD